MGDVLGAGVLELPGNFRTMGWAMGVLSTVGFALVALYLGLLVARVSSYFPHALTFGDLAQPSFGAAGQRFAHCSQHSYLVLTCALYLLLGSKTVQYLFYDVTPPLCQPLAGVLVVGLYLLPSQLRALHHISFLSALSFLSVLAYIALCLEQMLEAGSPPPGKVQTSVGPEQRSATWHWELLSALMGVVFAFSGIEV